MDYTPVYIKDHGDYYESRENKWDFPEHNIPVFIIGKYPYKAQNIKNARKLALLRPKIDQLCKNIENNRDEWSRFTNNQEYLDGVELFIGLHKEFYHDPNNLPEPFFSIALNGKKTSRYLLSEIPRGTPFQGLSKPKMRYKELNAPFIGRDGQGRALYRDIFVDVNLENNEFIKLIIHELAHNICNHIQYYPDNHHSDFKWAEQLITRYWPV